MFLCKYLFNIINFKNNYKIHFLFRFFQFSQCKLPFCEAKWIPFSTNISTHLPHRHDILGIVLVTRRCNSSQSNTGSYHPTDSHNCSIRNQNTTTTGLICESHWCMDWGMLRYGIWSTAWIHVSQLCIKKKGEDIWTKTDFKNVQCKYTYSMVWCKIGVGHLEQKLYIRKLHIHERKLHMGKFC